MRPRRPITQEDMATIFDEAVRERALAVLTLQTDDCWHSFKSRFLERDPNRRFFVLDHQAVNGHTPPELGPGQYIGVSFRNRARKVLFSSVVEAKGHFLFDDRTTIPAVRYRWPESVTELQRRCYYRTPVPAGATLLATMWPGGLAARSAAQGNTLQLLSGALVDISCGGTLVRLDEAGVLPWSEGQTLGVELQLADERPPLLVNANFRGIRHDQFGQIGVALQFIGLELSVDGRLVLQRLARCVQRLHRQSIASGMRDWTRPSGG